MEQRKEQRVQDKVQQEREAVVKKVALQEAKEAKQLRLQFQNKLKQARKLKRAQNNSILVTEEVEIVTVCDEEVREVEMAKKCPQRLKRLPRKLNNYKVDIS